MLKNEFNRLVARDSAPMGSTCEWCSRPAEHQMTAIGGVRHNIKGIFCRLCGEQFQHSMTKVPIIMYQAYTH
jgi:hypothetical protein